MARGKTVLVLGGGIGGTVAATRLRKMLPEEHRVVLVERESQHVFSPSFLWVMVGQRSADGISRPMAAMAKRGIELVQGIIEEIDPTLFVPRCRPRKWMGRTVCATTSRWPTSSAPSAHSRQSI